MSKSDPQSLKNHGRLDPKFHIVTFFVLFVNLGVSIVYLVHHLGFYAAWLVSCRWPYSSLISSCGAYPLKVQDRVIRLEERLRLQALAPARVARADLSPLRGPANRSPLRRR